MESFLARAGRVISAGVDTVVGAAERFSGDSLMRQAIRDIDGAADQLRKQRGETAIRARRAADLRRASAEQAARLEEQARFALVQGRDDLAQAAVEQQLAAEQRAEQARVAHGQAEGMIDALDRDLADLAQRQRRLEEQYMAEQAASVAAGPSPKLARRVGRAEEAFDRALSARAGFPADAPSPVEITELDRLQRERTVAERMAALREGLDAPARRQAGGRKRA